MNRQMILVSAGMLQPKKSDNLVARHYKYLNYGLLGLATVLQEHGYSPRVIHGGFLVPEDVAQTLATTGFGEPPLPLFLSVPSVFAVGWSRRFCAAIKTCIPGILIVAGGRWVVENDTAWLRNQIPQLDLVVEGTAEDRVVELANPELWCRLPGTNLVPLASYRPHQFLLNLDYSLLDDFSQFMPSIEVSRGCGRKCTFCVERDVPLIPMKSPDRITSEIMRAQRIYANERLRFYFEASMFRPKSEWVQELRDRRNGDSRFVWRCEARVDNLAPETVTSLAKAGLGAMDLGLESASPQQLVSMKKTRDPEKYLKNASELLQSCSNLGIWAKVNILLYPGENKDTISQTTEWLNENRHLIKGVSVYPLILFRQQARSSDYMNELRSLGAMPAHSDQIERAGFCRLHLSKEIDSEQAESLSQEISREYMSAKDFFELKSFGYFAPEFTYGEFMDAASKSDPLSLPFFIPSAAQEDSSLG